MGSIVPFFSQNRRGVCFVIIMANRFYARLAKEKGGAEKIRKIRGISPEVRPEYKKKAEVIRKEKAIRAAAVSEIRKRYGK